MIAASTGLRAAWATGLLMACIALPALRTASASPLPDALTITPVTASRGVYSSGTSICPGCGPSGEDEYFSNSDSDQNDVFGLFDTGVSSVGSDASQTSMISTTEISGHLAITLGFSQESSAYSLFSVTFQANTPGAYAVEGLFGDTGDISQIMLRSTVSTLFDHHGYSGESFRESFQLGLGETYTLEATIRDENYSGSFSTPSLTFQLVPEPTTGILLGLGLAGLGYVRRQR
jgi:hypothetical protein